MGGGIYLRYEGRPAVRFEQYYAQPAERLWQALAEPEQAERWFPSRVAFDPEAGGEARFTRDPFLPDFSGQVLAWEPPRRVRFTWGADELQFEFDDVDPEAGAQIAAGGAERDGPAQGRLLLTDILEAENAAARNAAGWSVCLAELDKVLAGTPSRGPHSADAAPWKPIYKAYIESGMPYGAHSPDEVG